MPEIAAERPAELRALSDAVEGLPWALHNTSTLYMNGKAVYYIRRDGKPGQAIHLTCFQAEAELVVAAVNAMPELLAEIERLRALVGDENQPGWDSCSRAEAIRQADELYADRLKWINLFEQMKAEREDARAELAKAREALTELATINPSAELCAKNRRREAEAQTVVYGISVNEWDRLWKLVEEIHRCTTPTPPTPSSANAASTLPADVVTALRDAGILACGADQARDEEAL